MHCSWESNNSTDKNNHAGENINRTRITGQGDSLQKLIK